MLIVPIQAVPNQSVQVLLSNQQVLLNIYLRSTNLYMDVYVDSGSTEIVVGVICQNINRIVRDLYFGFLGDFSFFDTQGTDDPIYTGLGARFQLIYIEPSDLPAGVG